MIERWNAGKKGGNNPKLNCLKFPCRRERDRGRKGERKIERKKERDREKERQRERER